MRGFKYILFTAALLASVGVRGQYNPGNPAEPGAPVTTHTLRLEADPQGGGSFNINAQTTQTEGANISLRAYTASNFTFVKWTTEEGETVSTNANFTYTMPTHDQKLIAHYLYTPSSPTEPSEPDIPEPPVYSNLYLSASPTGGGSFNIADGNRYEVGTTVNVRASAAQNFTFVNWTQDGQELSTSYSFNYVIREGADANRLVANFTYTPGSPGEPSEPEPRKVYHSVFLECNPAGGGYFNVESGNQYEEGSTQTFRAYNNQWYTFQRWTIDGEEVSTSSSYTMTIPNDDVTLTAHYTYDYNPGNPGEPSQPTDRQLSIYGMTATGMQGQVVVFPIYLENTEEVYGLTVVVRFPEGFVPKTDNVVLAERAAGHSVSVEALADNAYRFDLSGSTTLTGQNGKIFEVPVTISADAEPDESYAVVLSNGAIVKPDGSKEVISARNGYIFVEAMKEDGLYAQFNYEKLQGRVKFTNMSSDKAVSYEWDFGDGTTSTDVNPLHTYAQSGYYDVTLTAHGQTGTDVALMTVLINDEGTWQVEGTFFLDEEELTVRHFTNAADLLAFLTATPLAGNLTLMLKDGMTFGCTLDDDHLAQLHTLQTRLAEGGYTLTLAPSSSEGEEAVLAFGQTGGAVDTGIVSLFIDLGRSMTISDGAGLQLWGIAFDPTQVAAMEGQTVLSAQPTSAVDLSLISSALDYSWTLTAAPETAVGHTTGGTGSIPSMTITSGSPVECSVVYHVVATYQGAEFLQFDHTITITPALEGEFTELLPADGTELETTTVTLSWNSIGNAVYDVYLWNAANERPAAPVAEGITETEYTSRNFCQDRHDYKWQVVARNDAQQMESVTMGFSIRFLPNLHVAAIMTEGELEAGRRTTISWTVRNDGDGTTGEQVWSDRLWLVPDVYAGTAQSGCKLLATVPRQKTLDSGEQYTASAEVLFDEQSYGSYYLLVAADMSTVTLIDWETVGGTIVNPYEPTLGGGAGDGNYPYLFATTAAGGNQLTEHGETTTRSDNFFYQKVDIAMPTMDEEDWNILQTAYEQMGGGEGWTRQWNFDVERRTVQTLPGVAIVEGRVVSIDLGDNNITGNFPFSLLALPKLRSLDIGGNQLTGNVGEQMAAYVAEHPLAQTSLQTLDISNNQLAGNIGQMAQPLTALTTLLAEGNRLYDVQPMISTKVTTLTLGRQTLDNWTVELDAAELEADIVRSRLPQTIKYDHKKRNYDKALALLCSTSNDDWSMALTLKDGQLLLQNGKTAQNDYHGQSGDVVDVTVADASLSVEGSTLKLMLTFSEGDANFSGNTDVVDLQAQINFAFEAYKDKPFNFTAANLWTDELINVQDVVRMVDLLLNQGDGDGARRAEKQLGNDALPQMNTVYVENGKVWVNATCPVAAFELTLRTDDGVAIVPREGFTCRSAAHHGEVRLVGYSLSGATLPMGPVAVCEIGQGAAVVNAVLADADAEGIGVSIGGQTTGIAEVPQSDSMAPVFDLQGRQLTAPQKGIYIRNGKKIVNRNNVNRR